MRIQNKIWIGFVVSLMSLSTAGVFSYNASQQMVETSSWVSHTFEVEALIESVVSSLYDAETGQRGYLLTGDPNYLEPYNSGTSRIDGIVGELKTLTADNSAQQERVARMSVLVENKLAELEQTIALYRAGNPEESIDLMLTNVGKLLMDDIRSIALDMTMAESQLMVEREEAASTAVRSATTISGFGAILAFAIIGSIAIFVGRDANRYVGERDKAESELNDVISNLQYLLVENSTLEGIELICAYCKNIRNYKGSWEKLDADANSNPDAQFSHGICPECEIKVRAENDFI